jgi:hypothetical protein
MARDVDGLSRSYELSESCFKGNIPGSRASWSILVLIENLRLRGLKRS